MILGILIGFSLIASLRLIWELNVKFVLSSYSIHEYKPNMNLSFVLLVLSWVIVIGVVMFND